MSFDICKTTLRYKTIPSLQKVPNHYLSQATTVLISFTMIWFVLIGNLSITLNNLDIIVKSQVHIYVGLFLDYISLMYLPIFRTLIPCLD